MSTEQPQPQPRRSTWWIVPAVLVGLIVIAWLVLAGLPFGGDRRSDAPAAAATTETVAEGTVNAQAEPTGTIVEVGTEEAPPPPLATETTATETPMGTMTATTPPPVVQTPPPVIVEERRTPPPPIIEPQPRPAPAPLISEEISESEATSVLRGYLASNRPYDASAKCTEIRGAGYRNVGYTFSVWDTCVGGGGSQMLGRWRVDAKTREIFRQRDDGRYLPP